MLPRMKSWVNNFSREGVLFILASGIWVLGLKAQNSSFMPVDDTDPLYQVTEKKLIIPAILLAYGFAQFSIQPIADLNIKVKGALTGKAHAQLPIDNFSQYAPAAAVYGLNILGIKGKHNFFDRSVILATSAAVAAITVTGLKRITHIQRPDGSAYTAFPSGHTATAFACAEFLYQEYKDVSVWYGITGYAVAAGTGFLRMYNNRHWLADVVAGAGFGILSTKIAYWVFPGIKRRFFKHMQVNFSLRPSFELLHKN